MAISLKNIFPAFRQNPDPISDEDFRNHSKIIELFAAMSSERTLLKLKIPGAKHDFTSSVIDVDEKTFCFTMDEIFPEDGHLLFSRCGNAMVSGTLHGASISFNASLLGSNKSGQFTNYQCSIPDTISYIQRREEYRIKIPSTHLVRVTAQHAPTHQMLQGIVYDISMHGISTIFKINHSIKPGEQLIHCKLPIDDTDIVNFTLEVRHIESNAPQKILIGGLFSGLDTRAEEIISRFVCDMERLVIRHK